LFPILEHYRFKEFNHKGTISSLVTGHKHAQLVTY
jgi:hypothetical protein